MLLWTPEQAFGLSGMTFFETLMATLVLQTIGSVAGGAVGGPIGSSIGGVLGGFGGSLVDAALASPRYSIGPRLKSMDGIYGRRRRVARLWPRAHWRADGHPQ